MQVIIIILLLLAILLVIFTLQNAMDISINVFFWEIKDAPLVIVLLACILIGYLVASLYFYPKLWKTRREYNQLIKFNSELKELHEMNQKEQKTESDISTDPEGIELDDEDDGSIFSRLIMDEKALLLSTAYFAPLHFYARYIHHPKVYIEQFEHFNKQTYRNRCVISGGNGLITLVAPVVKGRGPKTLIKDLKLSYDMNWQRNQWQTIVSAYNSSPYFEYYQDELYPFFEKEYKFLLDFNLHIHETICDFLDIENTAELTEDFEKVPDGTLNFRDVISPKNKNVPDAKFQPAQYTQVFTEKFWFFLPNLSILDLLFNEGPNAVTILEDSLRE